VIVSVTEAGKAVFESFRCQFRTALRADLDGLPDEQLAELLTATDTLGSLVETLRAQAEPDRAI
jgi:DNA-binding MarR family transcriptional regulator